MWPEYKLASQLAGPALPLSEAMILYLAKKHGIGRKAGRCIIFPRDRVRQPVEEFLPYPSNSCAAQNRPTPPALTGGFTGSPGNPSGAPATHRAGPAAGWGF